MRTRNIVLALLTIAAIAVIVLLLTQGRDRERSRPLVGIIEPLQHVAVSDITRGVTDGLDGCCDLVVKNASSDKVAIPQILSQYEDSDVDFFVPIFTATAQATKATVDPERQIVFAAVTDPVKANLINNPKRPNENLTGVSDLWPIGSTLDLVRQILPSSKTIGLVYDPGDPNSESTLAVLLEESNARNFEVDLVPVHSTSEIAASLEALQKDIDLLFTANDVTVTAALPALVAFAIREQVPLFAGDYSSVERGAIGSVGQNYYDVGFAAGELVRRLAEGAAIADMPVVYSSGGDVFLNKHAAERMGVDIGEDVFAKADTVYDEILD